MTRLLIALALLLAAPLAHADRYGHGLAVFQQKQCTSCHSVGWHERANVDRPSNIDLTRITDTRRDDELRKFLADPTAARPQSACSHRALMPDEIEDLLVFLHMRANPQPVTPAPRQKAPGRRVRGGK